METIAKKLTEWYSANARPLPWRQTDDPYRVLVSEIMLQQTRVEAVIGYYARFLEAFPDVQALAQSDEQQLFKLWEGLGYYSRARNLRRAAEIIVSRFGGVVPSTAKELATLPGVGPYTSGAVASICFHERVPAVDGNALRIMARLFADDGNVLDPAVKSRITERVLALLPAENPGAFNAGLMELGQTVCLPSGAPRCELCPLSAGCRAYREKLCASLPVREKQTKRRVEEKTVFALCRDGRFYGLRRPDEGLLASLYALPDTSGRLSDADALAMLESFGVRLTGEVLFYDRKHLFTHVEWHMRVCFAHVEPVRALPEGWILLDESVHPLPTAYRVCLNAEARLPRTE